jgi:hypothetical protein
MLSRFTWLDLFVVGGIITALYYGYIAVVYYREDIREWLSNKGKKTPAGAAVTTTQSDDEEDEANLYSVHSYGDSEPVEPAEPEPAPVVAAAPVVAKHADNELNLAGTVIEEQEPFALPVNGTVVRPTEERLDDLIVAADGVSKDESGKAKAKDEQNQPAVRIASMINYQAGQAAFADISFNR